MINQEYDKNIVEHLRMLQGIIGRIANTSLGIKRYSLMIFTFVCTYLVINPENQSLYLLLLSTFIFVMMILFDMYYLSMERAFREKFNEDRTSLDKAILFDLSIKKIRFRKYLIVLFSKSIYMFYLPLLIVMITLFFLI